MAKDLEAIDKDLEAVIFHPHEQEHPHSLDERSVARGKAARKDASRARQAELDLRNRPDPIALLEEQDRSRIPELVALRYGRMISSPFAFFRGTALIMASDLARTPSSGIYAQLCGDAHLLNFGVFGTPEHILIFDVNDFDETLPGPWEWDVKRLATSLEIAARSNGFHKQQRHDIVVAAARTYHQTMVELAGTGNLEVWYAALNIDAAMAEFAHHLTHAERTRADEVVAAATHDDSAHALAKLTHVVDGKRRLVSSPPLIVPFNELLGKAEFAAFEKSIKQMLDGYRRSLPFERGVLFDRFRFVELARKVVGVGSVGTRDWIALFLGADNDDPLILQLKEAEASVLERFAGASEYPNHAVRVVAGQRFMQAASDLLLGWTQIVFEKQPRDFYVRQLRDWKGSVAVDKLHPSGLSLYGRVCAWTLARAHARSGDRVAIASYLGTNDHFEEAIATFSAAYADLCERDYEALVRAVRSGRVRAETESDAR